MTVRPLGPLDLPSIQTSDAPLDAALPPESTVNSSFAGSLAAAFGEAGAGLERAARAERAFANGRGGLQEMILERAQADVTLSIASAAASRAAQSLSTILGMQV
ncbi:MAG: hypothetical protein M3R53_08270 [Candidatus Eremiobacteraeota bacterium]|nr:hypothetical protein [Candidatus Eremiobacteraeota bacterium]